MSAATHLAQYNITVAEARAFIMASLSNPTLIYNVALQFQVDSEMLAEIYGGVSSDDVVHFFNSQGLDGTALLPSASAEAVYMRGTAFGSLNSQSAIEVQLPQPLSVSDLQNLDNYVSSLGLFGNDAQVVSMAQQGDPADYTSYIRIVPGSGTTFTPGSTTLSITASDSDGIVRKITFELPQIHFVGSTGNDVYTSTRNDELLDLSLGGADTIALATLPPNQSTDVVYNFTPGSGVDADALDLRAYTLSGGVADAQPGLGSGIQAYSSTASGGTVISNQVVLLSNTGPSFSQLSQVLNLFGLGKPFQLAADSKAVIIVFETADNFEDIYYVANDSEATVSSTEIYPLGQLKLNGVYTPGSGTYVDDSFIPGNFLL